MTLAVFSALSCVLLTALQVGLPAGGDQAQPGAVSEDANGTLKVQVVDATGKGLPRVEVHMKSRLGGHLETKRTDDNGQAEFEGLSPTADGSITVEARDPNIGNDSVTVKWQLLPAKLNLQRSTVASMQRMPMAPQVRKTSAVCEPSYCEPRAVCYECCYEPMWQECYVQYPTVTYQYVPVTGGVYYSDGYYAW